VAPPSTSLNLLQPPTTSHPPSSSQVLDTWAPEWVWDAATREFVIFWSAAWKAGHEHFEPHCDNPIIERFAFWSVRTRDWLAFSRPALLADPQVKRPSLLLTLRTPSLAFSHLSRLHSPSRLRHCLPTLSALWRPSRQCDMEVALSTATSLMYACMHASPCISMHLLVSHTRPMSYVCMHACILHVSPCISLYHTSLTYACMHLSMFHVPCISHVSPCNSM